MLDFDNEEEIEELELDEEVEQQETKDKWIYEFLNGCSREDIFNQIEKINNSKHYSPKCSECEYYNVDKEDIETLRLKQQTLDLFSELNIDKKECCSICGDSLFDNSGFIYNYEYYYWDNEKDYNCFRLCKYKIIHFNICKKCFIGVK